MGRAVGRFHPDTDCVYVCAAGVVMTRRRHGEHEKPNGNSTYYKEHPPESILGDGRPKHRQLEEQPEEAVLPICDLVAPRVVSLSRSPNNRVVRIILFPPSQGL